MTKKKFYDKYGYYVEKNLFSKSEINNIKSNFEKIDNYQKKENKIIYHEKLKDVRFIFGDCTSQSDFKDNDYIVMNPKLVSVAKELLAEQPVYFGESNMQSGLGLRGFHKDSRIEDRTNPDGNDWKGEYPILRAAIYLNNTKQTNGGIKIREYSHNVASNKIGRMIDVDTNLGDVVFWNLRTSHSGNVRRLRFFNSVCVHPRLEDMLPSFLFKKNTERRGAIFIVFGAKSNHLNNYLNYLLSRKDYLPYLKTFAINENLIKRSKKCKLILQNPFKT